MAAGTKKQEEEATEVQIVINDVPRTLVDEIDAMADREQRKRAPMVRILLEEIMAQKRKASARVRL